MGQVLSTAFIEKFFAEPAKNRRRRRKGRKKSFWKFLMNIFFHSWGTTSKTKPTFRNEKIQTDQANTFYSKYHNHIVCEHAQDQFIGVMPFLAGKEKFKSVDVPGKKIKIKVTQDVVRRLLMGLLLRFQHLHSEGKTLNGCFTAGNIYVPICKDQDALVTPYIEVKLGYVQSDLFSNYTKEGGDKDLMMMGWILQHEICSLETQLPEDLNQLLELLCNDPVKNQALIYGHVSLMGPRDQISHFLWLYKRLIFLKSKVPEKYKNIVKEIGGLENGWRTKAKRNKFLLKLKPFTYSSDGKGLLLFYRNSVEHLFEFFKDDKANSVSVVEEEELEDLHIFYILTETFPKLVGNLQKAFFEEDELLMFTTHDGENYAGDQEPYFDNQEQPEYSESDCYGNDDFPEEF